MGLDLSVLDTPQPTGVERAAATTVDALLALGDVGDGQAGRDGLDRGLGDLRPVLLSPVALPGRWRDDPRLECHVVPAGRGSWRERVLPRLARDTACALVHLPVVAVPWRLGLPAVATVHELPWCRPRALGGDRSWRHRLRTAHAAQVAARLVCVSEATAADLRERHPRCAGRVVVLPHALPPAVAAGLGDAPQRDAPQSDAPQSDAPLRDTPLRDAPLRDAPQSDAPHRDGRSGAAAGASDLTASATTARRRVLAVGRLRRKKNLARLLDAVATLPDVALVLVGPDGDAADALRARAARPDLAGRVTFAGHVDDQALAVHYRAADVLAHPSLLEGFGLPVLEALAHGLPVLAAEHGAADEALGDAALRVDGRSSAALAAGLRRLLDDAALVTDLARRGRAVVAARTPEQLARSLIALWREVAR